MLPRKRRLSLVKKIYKLQLLSLCFFLSVLWSEDYFIITNAPQSISIALSKAAETGLLEDKKIRKLTIEEQKNCIENNNCLDKIISISPKGLVLKVDYYENASSKEIFLTLLNLSTKTIDINNHIKCPNCSSFELIDKLGKHKLSDSDESSYSLTRPSYNFKYPKTDNLNAKDLIPILLSSTPPANVYIKNRSIGMSPVEVSGKKNQKIDLQFIDINHKKLTKSVTFKKARELNFKLIPLTTSLSLVSNPSKAKIYINNKSKGYTPKLIKDIKLTDSLDIRLELEDYISEEFIFNPNSESQETLSYKLEKGIGFLRIKHDSDSKDISVFINDERQGFLSRYNNNTIVIKAGKNRVRLVKGIDKNDSVERIKDFRITMDEYSDWETAFVDTVDISISF